MPERILGTDLDGEALDLARHHAVRAGVAGDIHFQQRDFLELSSKRTYGCVITNPPYAERMGSSAEVAGLYPCGEGAGFAGGIVSAALDGMRCAERLERGA